MDPRAWVVRRQTALTRAASSRGRIGLGMKSSAPDSRPATRQDSLSCLLRMMIPLVERLRIRRTSASPSPAGAANPTIKISTSFIPFITQGSTTGLSDETEKPSGSRVCLMSRPVSVSLSITMTRLIFAIPIHALDVVLHFCRRILNRARNKSKFRKYLKLRYVIFALSGHRHRIMDFFQMDWIRICAHTWIDNSQIISQIFNILSKTIAPVS